MLSPLYGQLSPLRVPTKAVIQAISSPLTLPNLRFWLDANSGLFDATSGGNAVNENNLTVARWEDQSGNNRHFTQGTLNNRPVLKTSILNNKNVLEFDGTNDTIRDLGTVSSYANSENAYIFCIVKDLNPTGGNSQHISVFVGRGVSGSSRMNCSTRISGNLFAGQFRKSTETLNIVSSVSNSSFNVLSYIIKASNGQHELRSNQNQIAFGTFSAGPFANETSLGRAIGGLDTAAAGFFLPGQVGEVIVGTGQLTNAQILGTEEYLKIKWGL